MNLYIKQRFFALGDTYDILDENEKTVFKVKSQLFTIGSKIHLSDAADQELFYIEKKLFRFMPAYEIYRGETLCAVVQKEVSFFSHHITVESDYGNFELNGDIFAYNFNIELNGTTVGVLSKEFLTWGDCYAIRIAEGQDPAFLCALAITIDQCEHEGKN